MPVSRPGFGGEMRDRDGVLTTYDDVGCLLRAIFAAHREVPEAWVEDHDGAGLVPLLAAHLVRAEGADTPMGYGIVAFADEAAASRYAAARSGQVLALEDVLRSPTMVARPLGPSAGEGGETR
jgi:copper chaperone NosL